MNQIIQDNFLLILGTIFLLVAFTWTILRRNKRHVSTQQSKKQYSKDPAKHSLTPKISESNPQQDIQSKTSSRTAPKTTDIKKKKKKTEDASEMKTSKQLEQQYPSLYYGVLSLKSNNSMSVVEAVTMKNSKVLLSNSKNELVLYDLKKWKKDSSCQERYFTSLDNNTASAIAIGTQYYYVALTFEKTIAYYEFKGGEGGIYFREVNRFARNIYKSNISSLYVPQSEKYIVGTGSEADTVINVWSMSGERLAQVNTYQIQHYDIKYGANKVLVRGWTSEVKLFQLVTDKQGYFIKIDKNHHLTHSQQARCSAIDNLGLYAVTVCGNDVVKIWAIYSAEGHLTEKAIDAYQVGIQNVSVCAVHTLKDVNDRLRTLVVLANSSKVVICDRQLKSLQSIEGIAVNGLYITGSMKSAVLGTLSQNSKLNIWNISDLAAQLQGYVLN